MLPSPPGTRPAPTPLGITSRPDGVWEKQTPSYSLDQVKQVVRQFGMGVFGFKAVAGVAAMQLNMHQAVNTILRLQEDHFFKSMTAAADTTHALWQDVYHGPTENGLAYIKFMLWFPPPASSTAAPVLPSWSSPSRDSEHDVWT